MIHLFGLGSEFRQDDALGLRLAQRIQHLQLPYIQAKALGLPGFGLLSKWQGLGRVVLVDCLFGEQVGRSHWLNLKESELEINPFREAHGQGLAECLQLGKTLGQLPQSLHLFGVESTHFQMDNNLSSEIEDSLIFLEAQLLEKVNSLLF